MRGVSSLYDAWEWTTEADDAKKRYCRDHCTPRQDGSIAHLTNCGNRPVPSYQMWDNPANTKGGIVYPQRPGPFRPGTNDVRDAVDVARRMVDEMDAFSETKRRLMHYMLDKMAKASMNEIGMGSDDMKALGMSNMHKHLRQLTEKTRWGYYRQPLFFRRSEPKMRENKKSQKRHYRENWYVLRDPRGRHMVVVDDGVEAPTPG